MIDIALIPMTSEPMEGVAFDVQDYARQTSTILDWYTWGDDQFETPWGWRAHQMDVGTPLGGKDRIEMGQGVCTREGEDIPPEVPWQSLT